MKKVYLALATYDKIKGRELVNMSQVSQLSLVFKVGTQVFCPCLSY